MTDPWPHDVGTPMPPGEAAAQWRAFRDQFAERKAAYRWEEAARYASLGGSAAAPPATVPTPDVLNATVARVYDGDTIYVNVHYVGQLYSISQPVRLLGCNAAELRTPGGDAAAANLAALLPAGAALVLSSIGVDKYAPRWDCAVAFIRADGLVDDLVRYLVDTQWAAPWDGRGTKPVPPWPRTVA